MTQFFDLTTEPWIPVRMLDGAHRTVGLRTLIVDAPAIADIEAYPPIAYAVVMRIAAALVLRTQGAPLGEHGSAAWQQWGETRLAEGPDATAIDTYFDRWADRFWLLHPTTPFLQDAAIATECDKRSSTNKLRFDVASGNNFLWWTKVPDGSAPVLGGAAAAMHLLSQWGFGSGGRCASRSGIADSKQSPLRPRTQFIPRCANLWATLLACSAPAVGDAGLASRDCCSWERAPGVAPVPGQLGRLTESTRGLLLFGGADGIDDAVITWGVSLPDTFFNSDVFTGTRRNKDGTTSPYQLPYDRLAWTEIPPLLAKLGNDPETRVTPATVLDPVTNPIGRTDEFFDGGITTVTHFSDKSKDIDWSRSELPAVLGVLEEHDPSGYTRIRQYCTYARDAIALTFKAAKAIPTPGGMDKETRAVPDFEAFRRQLWLDAEEGFWRTLRGAPWESEATQLRTTCIGSFAAATATVTDARRLTGTVLAERKLRSQLRSLDHNYGLTLNTKGVA